MKNRYIVLFTVTSHHQKANRNNTNQDTKNQQNTKTQKHKPKTNKPKNTPHNQNSDVTGTSSWVKRLILQQVITVSSQFMHDDSLCAMIIMAPKETKTKRHPKNTRGQFSGCKKQQSSMPKPGIPPARIPEITKSSHPGMTFTLTL